MTFKTGQNRSGPVPIEISIQPPRLCVCGGFPSSTTTYAPDSSKGCRDPPTHTQKRNVESCEAWIPPIHERKAEARGFSLGNAKGRDSVRARVWVLEDERASSVAGPFWLFGIVTSRFWWDSLPLGSSRLCGCRWYQE